MEASNSEIISLDNCVTASTTSDILPPISISPKPFHRGIVMQKLITHRFLGKASILGPDGILWLFLLNPSDWFSVTYTFDSLPEESKQVVKNYWMNVLMVKENLLLDNTDICFTVLPKNDWEAFISAHPGLQVINWITSARQMKQQNTPAVYRLCHQKLGGVTTGRTYSSYQNIPSPCEIPKVIPQSVGNIINRQNVWGYLFTPHTFIKETGLVPIGNLDTVIQVRNEAKNTFVYQKLDMSERLKVFDVPKRNKSIKSLKILPSPFKAIQFIVSDFLQRFGQPKEIGKADLLSTLIELESNPCGIWLNDLQQYLPHS